MPDPLSAEHVRKVARLARLDVAEGEIEQLRHDLGAVLGYIERLRELDLGGVEPMTTVGETRNRMGEDVPGATLANEVLMRMAPEARPPYLGVPKVLGDGGVA